MEPGYLTVDNVAKAIRCTFSKLVRNWRDRNSCNGLSSLQSTTWHWPGIFLWEPKGVFQELIESNSWSMSSFLQLFHSQLLHLPSAAVQSCPLCGLSWPIGLQFKSELTTVKVFDGAQSIMTFFSLLKITPLCTPTVWKMIEMSVKLLFTVRWTFLQLDYGFYLIPAVIIASIITFEKITPPIYILGWENE